MLNSFVEILVGLKGSFEFFFCHFTFTGKYFWNIHHDETDGSIVRCEGVIHNENEDETTNMFSDSSIFHGTALLRYQDCYVFLTQKLANNHNR